MVVALLQYSEDTHISQLHAAKLLELVSQLKKSEESIGSVSVLTEDAAKVYRDDARG